LQSEPRILSILKPCLFPSLGVSPAEAEQLCQRIEFAAELAEGHSFTLS
jgi:hypothetical protein